MDSSYLFLLFTWTDIHDWKIELWRKVSYSQVRSCVPTETQLRIYYSKDEPVSSCTLLVLKFASYSFSLSFKFARFNFATLLRLIRASNFPCSFFLVCLIELLTINVFIMSVFINKYYNICQNLINRRLGGPQKMPSKLCKLCNARKMSNVYMR